MLSYRFHLCKDRNFQFDNKHFPPYLCNTEKKESKYKSLKIKEYENFRIYQTERIGSKQRSSIFATTISRLPSVLHQSSRFPLEYQGT